MEKSFNFQAIDSAGEVHHGRLEAAHETAAREELRRRGLAPLLIAARGVERAGFRRVRRPGRIPGRKLAIFTRQLAALNRAGLPLLRSLELLEKQERRPELRRVLTGLQEAIRSGRPLSAGMQDFPETFDALYINLVRAGEVSGTLDGALERLARSLEEGLRLRGRIRAALAYPVAVLAVAGLIIAGLVLFVVPRFEMLFADLMPDRPLPMVTQAILSASGGARSHFPHLVLAAAAGCLAAAGMLRSRRGRSLLRRAAFQLPGIGPVLRSSSVAGFAQTLGTLLASGVPVLEALGIARDASEDPELRRALDVVRGRVAGGDPIAAPLESTGRFPPMVAGMVEVGEATGGLPEMLHLTASFYEEEARDAVAGLTALLEPALIVLLAVIVGSVVLALFLPLVSVIEAMA